MSMSMLERVPNTQVSQLKDLILKKLNVILFTFLNNKRILSGCIGYYFDCD